MSIKVAIMNKGNDDDRFRHVVRDFGSVPALTCFTRKFILS